MSDEELDELIRQWTLLNAIEHGGEAATGAIIGKIVAEKPELKSDIQELKGKVNEIVSEVNEIDLEEQKTELEEIGAPEREEKEEGGLKELPETERYSNIVTRFAPNPNGPLHLGHVRTAVLSHEYAERNDGDFILRFEDTNPVDAEDVFYDMVREDLDWLGLNWSEEYIQSDRLDLYYEYLEELLEDENAYVCDCEPEKFKELRDNEKPCPCRDLSSEKNFERWEKMKNGGYEEGEAAVRIKTDIEHENPALRDWPALRIVDAVHPKTGDEYRVWPLYNFSVTIDDHSMGVTHVVRGKEHEINERKQRQLFKHLGWEYPTAIQHGRLSVSGTVLSKTQISEGINQGKFDGYDDVRLGTIRAVRRRGITPEALREIVLDVGTTKADSTLSMDTLYTKNRRVIDEEANRFFFVKDPEELLISNPPEEEEVSLRLHPDDLERGDRNLPLEFEDGFLKVWLSKDDLQDADVGDIIRLKDFFNFELVSKEPLKAEFEGYELKDGPKIQWVSKDPLETEVLKPDGTIEEGYSEPEVSNLDSGDVVQFERYGFVRIDDTDSVIKAVYTHS